MMLSFGQLPSVGLRAGPFSGFRAGMTSFQKKVLRVVVRVPRGRVTTYADIARAIGHPRAMWAVGQGFEW